MRTGSDEQHIYAEILARAPENDLEPSLARVQAACELLGDPQRAYPVIHVTGTNGKTSTARMIERLVREHGLRTGRFTSPHLTSVRERIAIDGEPISPEAFVAAYEDVAPFIEMVDQRSEAEGGPRMTFFEVLTVMAYAAFADAPIDVAIIEVGMGGTWDATNVADGSVAVITPIARDHERWLGSELTDIAAEKSGIIKGAEALGRPAIVIDGAQREEVDAVIGSAAAERGARVMRDGAELDVVARVLAVGGQLVSLQGMAGVYTDIFLPLHGEHQAHNALLALAATEAFMTQGYEPLRGEIVEAAFADATSPGRLELVRKSPPVVVDAAHNPAGAEVAMVAVDEAFSFSTLVGVVGVLADKDAEGILSVLEPWLTEIVITASDSPRALSVEDLAEIAIDVFGEDRVHIAHRLPDALDMAAGLAEQGAEAGREFNGGVIVTGSITLVADARILLGADDAPRHASVLSDDDEIVEELPAEDLGSEWRRALGVDDDGLDGAEWGEDSSHFDDEDDQA